MITDNNSCDGDHTLAPSSRRPALGPGMSPPTTATATTSGNVINVAQAGPSARSRVTCVTAIAGRGFAPILSDLSVRAMAGRPARPAYLAIGPKLKEQQIQESNGDV